MSDRRIEIARRSVDAWNARDIDWMRENASADMEFVPAVSATVDGTSVRGPEEMIRFLEAMDESWESFRIEPGEYRVVGEHVVGSGRIVAKGRGSGLELDQPAGSLFTFAGDKIVRMQSFLSPEQAMAEAERLSAGAEVE